MQLNNKQKKDDVFYDVIDDYDLIESSFLKQYGIRLRTVSMKWDEFINLISGLMPDTPLGNVIGIRSESDAKIIKGFSNGQKEIYHDWKKNPKHMITKEDYNLTMDALFKAALD